MYHVMWNICYHGNMLLSCLKTVCYQVQNYEKLSTVLPWIVTQEFISLQWFFIPATKQDKHLLVQDSCAVYNLWCQRWILRAADDAWSTILYVYFVTMPYTWPLNKTKYYVKPAIIWSNMVYFKKHMHTHIQTHMHTHTNTHTYTHTLTHIQTHTWNTYKHTHKQCWG